jgi:hypothetical protein
LVERGGRSGAGASLADNPVGTLANTVTFYDSLRREDIFGRCCRASVRPL